MKSRRDRRLVFGYAPEAVRPELAAAVAGPTSGRVRSLKSEEMTWHDHLVMLLHIGAEIEHGLMVQYLYAGYSLGGEQVPVEHRPMVQRWRESILAVAKEEMGHLLTVQNILTLLGASINLDRDDFPWDIQYYPFTFKLERFTMESLSCYVYAEMPRESEFVLPPGKRLLPRYLQFKDKDKAAIVKRVKDRVSGGNPQGVGTIDPHRVGAIYDEIIDILGDRKRIPDSTFQDRTFGTQASWDDWGRGYQPDPRQLDAEGNLVENSEKPAASGREAHVIIDRVATRTQAIAALRALSAQGEAPHLAVDETGEPSHFDRFLEIYQEFDTIKDEGLCPSIPVPENPTVLDDPNGHPPGFIQMEHSRKWAELFNMRYRILLTYLSHTFRLARVTRSDVPSVRAVMMHRVFGEMYNLKTIAGILVRLPFRDAADGSAGSNDAACAGPPFEMPYSLALPPAEIDVWRLHRDLLGSAARQCYAMLDGIAARSDAEGQAYLQMLIGLDSQSRAWIDQVLTGLGSTERHCV